MVKFNYNFKHCEDLPNEIWKDTYDKDYKVSNLGRVKSFATSKPIIVSVFVKENGYLSVHIRGKREYVHRLVATAFCSNPNNYTQVNHKDENKSNNCADNLEWCNQEYNSIYSLGKKVYQIDPISKNIINVFDSIGQAAKYVNGNTPQICQVCNRVPKYNTAYGYIWRYEGDNDFDIKDNLHKSIEQLDYETEEVVNRFESLTAAAKYMKVHISSIRGAIIGKSKSCKGYKWRYGS